MINFHGATPESVYNSVDHHTDKDVTMEEFKYDVQAYYGDLPLVDSTGAALSITALIGVKGDITLSNMVDATDCSIALSYYAFLSVNGNVPSGFDICGANDNGLKVPESSAQLFEDFAAFLGDVTENEWDAGNWSTKKNNREISSVDASQILGFYARRSSSAYSEYTNGQIWKDMVKNTETEEEGS